MNYEKEGILASIDRSENLVIVKDFERLSLQIVWVHGMFVSNQRDK